MAVGGFATGLRFGGDAEFLRRVHHIARVVNIPAHGYYRRIRQNSLTTAPATRIGSPVRKQIMEMTFERANRNAELVASGREPDLSPPRTAAPVGFTRLAGPELKPGTAALPLRRHGGGGPPSPVFVVGADRSGVSALACALGQHRRIALSVDGGWIGEFGRTLQDGRLTGERFRAALGGAASDLAVGARRRWVDGSFEHTSSIPPPRRCSRRPGSSTSFETPTRRSRLSSIRCSVRLAPPAARRSLSDCVRDLTSARRSSAGCGRRRAAARPSASSATTRCSRCRTPGWWRTRNR